VGRAYCPGDFNDRSDYGITHWAVIKNILFDSGPIIRRFAVASTIGHTIN